MKFIIAFIIVILASTPCYADMYIGAKTMPKNSSMGHFAHIGWEENKKHPFVITYTYIDSYQSKNRFIKKHQTVTGGKQWSYNLNGKWTAYAEFGIAAFDKKTVVSPMHFAFYESVGIKYDRYRIFFRHTSNAGIKRPNVGENMLVFAIDIYQ